MVMHTGCVDEYNKFKKNFVQYLERTDQWMVANDIEDRKTSSAFLSMIGADI